MSARFTSAPTDPPGRDAASRRLPRYRRRGGVALVIILAFIVLLTGLVIAFFSRSILDRQISNSSASEAKVSAFADGAASAIIGELKQEIALSSSAVPIISGTGLTSGTIYAPLTPWGMLPQLTGTLGITGTVAANLLKISGAGQLFYSGTSVSGSYATIPVSGVSNVIAVSSTIPSMNGRYVTPARWNEHYLLPLLGSTDATPDPTTFIPPSWVLVARDGSNPAPSALTPAMLSTGTNPVVGRYAFAVYHEGGLIDINAAGYPSTSSSNQTAYKSALAYADLTQIPGMSGTLVDAIVGWRNYATTQAPGASFTAPGFTSQSASNYYNYVVSNTTGFLSVTGTALNSSQTDRMFTSRQQLIQFFQNGLGVSGTNLDVLNYLTHFSRALEQPSYIPDPNRPKIVGTLPLPPASSATSYVGNNSYCGGEGAINMTGSGGFLSVRVISPFTRIDGSTAVPGEPLVKRKFALSRLQLVTTTASATASGTNPIYAEFGLSRTSGTGPWLYNHGSPSNSIMTLQQVAAVNREPDFAELLKAAIDAGSVGKAAPSGQGGCYEYPIDASGDIQILQIMANLIDQQKTDNYPIWIQFVDSSGNTRNIYGIQDLPYFYRWHYFSLTTKVPSPLLTNNNTLTVTSGTTTYKMYHLEVQGRTTLQSGSASYMMIPQIWNPNDANTPVASGGGPSVFRVVAETTDPTGAGAWQIRAQPSAASGHFDGDASNYIPNPCPPASTYSPYVYLSATNGSFIQFSGSGPGAIAKAFREPTLLWRNGYPSGITLSGSSRSEDLTLGGRIYYGIVVGDTPVSWITSITGTNFILQASNMERGPINPGPSSDVNGNVTFEMQYQDTAGNWIPYQDAYVEATLTNIPGHTLFVNTADYSSDEYKNPINIGLSSSGPELTAPMSGPYDPRSMRFATPITGRYNQDDPNLNGNPTLDAVTMVGNMPPTASQNLSTGTSNFVLMVTQRPSTSRGQFNDYTTPCWGPQTAQMHWYSSTSWLTANGQLASDANFFDGLMSQNNPALLLLGRDGVTQQQEYYEDPDGVSRRAMGGYVPVKGLATGRLTNTGTTAVSTIGLPMATAMASYSNGIVTPSTQSQSRATILHRPFRNVAEMGYAFRGTPWKNIDFFSPESGDVALLDVFCINEPPTNPMVGGKVNLNTRQEPVIQAILAGSYRDAVPANTLPALSATSEAVKIANLLVGITESNLAWRGPLTNVGDLVGHFVDNAPSSMSGADYFQTASHNSTGVVTGTYTYAGLSAALSGTSSAQDGSDVWDTPNNISSRNIQRFRESAIRPLADCGQTRVWNLMIDVISQSGRYPSSASDLGSGFLVEGEKRYWIHIAIDRITGQVIDRQIESVPE